jgi:glutamyl endopeptidase
MAKHESVSSEQMPKIKGQNAFESQDDQLHGSVSSEIGGPGGEVGEEFVVEDFRGIGGVGELEVVSGFDPTRAFSKGIDGEIVPLTESDKAIPACCPDRMENICGNDDRVQIYQTTEIPWRWICQLIITAADGAKYRCTGWFIGPHTVMTAGHCVYMHDNGGWAKQIEVIPGMNADSRPFGSQVSTAFRSVVGWTKNKDWNFDYGAIILPNNNLGNKVGWFGFAVLTDSSLNNLLSNNSGYPGDKPFGTQWFNAGRVTKITDRKFYYMIDTMGGQSGSPVWRLFNGQRQAIGVHAYGGCPNSATRITKAVFDNMVAWKA